MAERQALSKSEVNNLPPKKFGFLKKKSIPVFTENVMDSWHDEPDFMSQQKIFPRN